MKTALANLFRRVADRLSPPRYPVYPVACISMFPAVSRPIGSTTPALGPQDTVGIGVQFEHRGRLCRVAVKLRAQSTPDELRRAWMMLAKAVANPEDPASGAAFDHDPLLPRCLDATK